MLVQFERPHQDSEGHAESLAINPAHVSAVFPSADPGVTIVRGPDGRGLRVSGEYGDVLARFNRPELQVVE